MKDFDLEERVNRAVRISKQVIIVHNLSFWLTRISLNWIWRQPRKCLSLLEEV